MELSDRIGMVVKSNINALVTAAEDPEKMLEQGISDARKDLLQLRQTVAYAAITLKYQEQEYHQAIAQAEEWDRVATLALANGSQSLAQEALNYKKTYVDKAAAIKVKMGGQTIHVENLKKTVEPLENKIIEAKTKKDSIKVEMRSSASDAISAQFSTKSETPTFERSQGEALPKQAQAINGRQTNFDILDSKFAALEAGSGLDDELEAMKAQLAASKAPALPLTDSTRSGQTIGSVIDAELEALRRQMGK
ncbi:MAG: PspA/IM30 family protein [Pseudanabaenaceae cyanobacterium]